MALSPLAPGQPGKIYVSRYWFGLSAELTSFFKDPNDPSTYPSADPSVYHLMNQKTGGSVAPPQTTQNTSRSQYSGVPELWGRDR